MQSLPANSASVVPTSRSWKPQAISIDTFVRSVCAQTDAVAPIAFLLDGRRHFQPARNQDAGDFAKTFAGERNAFITPAGFDYAAAPKRLATTARLFKAIWVDVDVRKKDTDPGYADDKEADAAWRAFAKEARLPPTLVVHSGHGWHLYYTLDRLIPLEQWKPLAQRLVLACERNGLQIDRVCTTDAARVMRLPGTINHKPERGKDRLAGAWRAQEHDYSLLDLDARLPPLESSESARRPDGAALAPNMGRNKLDVNSALGLDDDQAFPRTPENEALVRSALTALARSLEGKPYPREVWLKDMFALASLDATHGWGDVGAELAVELSRSTSGYTDEADVHKALGSYNPSRADRVGVGSLLRRATNVGWARPTFVAPAAPEPEAAAKATSEAGGASEPGPRKAPWLVEMNARYAVVRWGSGAAVLDRQTPTQHADGIRNGPGFLEVGALKQLLRGRDVLAGGRHGPLADAWLRDPGRRQYDAAVFAPGETTPASVLNLWQGFAVEPIAGDIDIWLDLFDSLVPDQVVRRYVLCWLAWKVQNPGRVPGTILVMTGGKGAGKNSLFDPVVRMFGAHGRVFDDSEQIAGRFTGHLMTVAFAVLDEALFVGDPRQNDRIKARVTATHMTFEHKGRDPVQGLNRCAYVSLSNHEQVWQATADERRAVIVEAAATLTGDGRFWSRYYQWLDGGGTAALLHHLQHVALTEFDVRAIPRSNALRRQVEMTALRDPTVAWWHTVLTEGAVSRRTGSLDRSQPLAENETTTIAQSELRESFEQAGRRRDGDFAVAMKRLRRWHPTRTTRRRLDTGGRNVEVILPSLAELREQFTAATGVHIETAGDEQT